MDSNTLPSPTVLAEAADLDILDPNGKAVRFGSLFESKKSVFVFIRAVHPFASLALTI
jgi:hypothetical protein